MSCSRKVLRRCQSYAGKSQFPSYGGVMAEFMGWQGWQRSRQIYLTGSTQLSFRADPVQVCLEDFHATSYNKASWSERRHCSKFSCKTFNMVFSSFLHSALHKALFLQKIMRIKISVRGTRTYRFCGISSQIHIIPSEISHQLSHLVVNAI